MSFLHGGAPSVIELAANAYGIIRNHLFIDDTKRTGFLAAYVFLSINGWPEHLDGFNQMSAFIRPNDEMRQAQWNGASDKLFKIKSVMPAHSCFPIAEKAMRASFRQKDPVG